MTVSTDRRVRFIEDWDYKPSPQVTLAFKAGDVKLVTAACAEKAIRLKKAEPTLLKPPNAGIAAKIAAKTTKGLPNGK